MSAKQAFTGRVRRHRTRSSVKAADTIARGLITVGGVGTILAVSLVFVFLAWMVYPLFQETSIYDQSKFAAAHSDDPTLLIGTDEYQVIGWSLQADGHLLAIRLDNGESLTDIEVPNAGQLSAASLTVDGKSLLLGYEDGSVRMGAITFKTTFPSPEALPEELRGLGEHSQATYEGGALHVTKQGDLRLQKLVLQMGDAVQLADAKLVALDHARTDDVTSVVGITDQGEVRLGYITRDFNEFTGAERVSITAHTIPARASAEPPSWVRISGLADSVNVVWSNGLLDRFEVGSGEAPVFVEQVQLTSAASPGRVTACDYLLGGSTIIVGQADGTLSAWFRVRQPGVETADGTTLIKARDLPPGPAPVTTLGMASRLRMFAAGFADGSLSLYHVTSGQRLVTTPVRPRHPVSRAAITPRSDGVLALSGGEYFRSQLDVAHPEATFATLFLPVWYENEPEPKHIWQSSGATDYEMKLGLYPLVFGTLKATFYSMLFGAPIALLAAIYTSEFLHPSARNKIKPTIEMMASLPSVVLGFLAGLVIAPWVQGRVPETLMALFAVPFFFLLASYLWQLLPYRVNLRLQWWRMGVILLTLPLGLVAAFLLGPVAESWLFGGDIMHWLSNHDSGTGTGGWMLLLLPLASVATALLVTALINPRLRALSAGWSRRMAAVVSLCKFLLGSLFAFLLALLLSWLLAKLGFDPRGTYVGSYDKLNTLIVGFAMGFAVIPIIYTIADDALTTVPQHLRSASLASGATPWQTAIRIVIPTAMSGLFSALMIGLGRAVGETMIVLMAAGNTPLMDLNIFNGFRTLSANLAVELPEAAKGDTHYRTLFLAALTLFLMTFLVNTVAEIVRLRFRRRAYQL